MGITRISNVTGLDVVGIPVAMACRPNSRSISVTQGKGLTLVAAKVSALMEAVEGYHADHITLPLRLGSYRELEGELPLVEVERVLTSDGRPFQSDHPLLWIEGINLLTDELVWLPFDLVHCDFTYASRLGRRLYRVTTNGLASGNHILEAVSHAICEVVERDATALWRMGSNETLRETRLDLGTVDDPGCRLVLDCLEQAGLTVAAWDITSEVGLPCFYSVVVGDGRTPFGPMHASEGAGCHPRREIALLRALTEAIQSRLTIIVGSRDDVYRGDFSRLRSSHSIDAVNGIMIRSEGPGRSFQNAPTFDLPTFQEDVALELSLLKDMGVTQVVLVDLTKRKFEVPVARVVIPGFEFFVSPEDFTAGPRARAAAAMVQ